LRIALLPYCVIALLAGKKVLNDLIAAERVLCFSCVDVGQFAHNTPHVLIVVRNKVFLEFCMCILKYVPRSTIIAAVPQSGHTFSLGSIFFIRTSLFLDLGFLRDPDHLLAVLATRLAD
jgi:hypothetical protein